MASLVTGKTEAVSVAQAVSSIVDLSGDKAGVGL